MHVDGEHAVPLVDRDLVDGSCERRSAPALLSSPSIGRRTDLVEHGVDLRPRRTRRNDRSAPSTQSSVTTSAPRVAQLGGSLGPDPPRRAGDDDPFPLNAHVLPLMFVVSGVHLRTPAPGDQRPPVASRERSPRDCQTAAVRTLATVARFAGIAVAVVVGLELDPARRHGRRLQRVRRSMSGRSRRPLLEDDVFGMAAAGAALIVGVPIIADSRRRGGGSASPPSPRWAQVC